MTRRLPVPSAALVLAALVPAAVGGCASSGGGLAGDPADYGSPSARMAVERFLAGVRAEDYMAMGQQFGTRKGPAEERLGVTEVEQRMIFLSGLLQHEEADLREADLARTGEWRTRFVATLQGTDQGRVAVPIVAVESKEGRWFVERIDTDPLTRDQ